MAALSMSRGVREGGCFWKSISIKLVDTELNVVSCTHHAAICDSVPVAQLTGAPALVVGVGVRG